MDDNTRPFLRLHLDDGDQIDLDEVDGGTIIDDTIVLGALLVDPVIMGRHAGGNRCAVPTDVVRWAEIIQHDPDDSE